MRINLQKKYTDQNVVGEIERDFNEYKSKIKGFRSEHEGMKIGDQIEFKGGYDYNITYQTKILGFDQDGGVYVLWDCYWVPIFIRDKKRGLVKIEKQKN